MALPRSAFVDLRKSVTVLLRKGYIHCALGRDVGCPLQYRYRAAAEGIYTVRWGETLDALCSIVTVLPQNRYVQCWYELKKLDFLGGVP